MGIQIRGDNGRLMRKKRNETKSVGVDKISFAIRDVNDDSNARTEKEFFSDKLSQIDFRMFFLSVDPECGAKWKFVRSAPSDFHIARRLGEHELGF